MAVLSIKDYPAANAVTTQEDNAPSQEELMKKLTALIILMQHMQTLLSGNTSDDIARISEQNRGMNVLAEIELAETKKTGDEILAKIEAIHHQSWLEKLFSNLLGSLMVLAGALLALTGNVGLGAIMMTCGVIGLMQANNPGLLDKGLTALIGNNPWAKLGAKIMITLTAAGVGYLAGGPAGAFMLAGALGTSLNIGQECVALDIKIHNGDLSDEEVQKQAEESQATMITNLAIMGAMTLGSIGGGIYSFAKASETAEVAATSAVGAALGGAGAGTTTIVQNASAVGAAVAAGVSDVSEGVALADKIKQMVMALLKALVILGSILSEAGIASTNIAQGRIKLELADAQEEYAKIKANSVTTQQIQEMISANMALAVSFLKDLSKNVEKLNSATRNMFSDHTAFAKMYAKLVTNTTNQ